MNTKNSFFALVLSFLAGTGTAGIVSAQDGSADTVLVRSLEEIIVTARRREENLQELPMSITVISSEDLELHSIENTKDLQLLLPNVDIRGEGRQGGAVGNFTIRGIRGVTRYIDGVVLTGDQGSLANVVEFERIEILRGPQGTYFGKNAIGGAIQYITKKPGSAFSARVKATYGSFDRQDLVISADIPLSETVKTKITAGSLYRGGYVESTTINQSYGEKDDQILTGTLEWTPTDNFNALFTATSNIERSGMQAYVLFDVIDDFFTGPRTPEAYNNPAVSTNPFTDELYAFGGNEQYLSAADYRGTGVDFESFATSATLNWDINSNISLKSITGSRDLHHGVWQDSDATPLGFFNSWAYDEVTEISQELQLYGSNDRLDWIVGVYYQNQTSTEVDSDWQRIELTGVGDLGPRIRNTLGKSDITDTAIYAEVVYEVADKLSVTLGARFSKEEIENTTLTPLSAITAADMNTPNYNTEGIVTQVNGVPMIANAESDATTPRVAVQYQMTDDIMIYAGVAQGFNAGGINKIFNPSLPNNGIIPYAGEILTSYEVGFRSDLFDNRLRLNATAFWGNWDDFQIDETLTPGQTTTTNGGAAETSGFEVEGQWRVNNQVSVDFTFGKLSAEYTDVGAATTIDVDTRFPFSPETSYSVGLQWDKDLINGSHLTSRMDWGWIDDFETSSETIFQTALGANESYGLLSGRVAYRPPSGNYTIALFGTNLTDQWYRLGGFAAVLAGIDQGVVARPREIGVSLTIDF